MVEDREIGCWGTGRSLTSNVAFAENSSLQLVKRNRSVTALGFKSRHRSRSRSALRFRQPHSDLDRHQKEVPFGYVFHVGELWMFMSALTDFRWRLPRPFSELGAQGMTTTSCACSGGTPRPAARTDIFRAGTSRTCELGPGHDGRRRDLPQSVLRLPWPGREGRRPIVSGGRQFICGKVRRSELPHPDHPPGSPQRGDREGAHGPGHAVLRLAIE